MWNFSFLDFWDALANVYFVLFGWIVSSHNFEEELKNNGDFAKMNKSGFVVRIQNKILLIREDNAI